jgi:pimeloyl-ACP methyl ester carboxylesterase
LITYTHTTFLVPFPCRALLLFAETKLLHPDHPSVHVNATFRDSYFLGDLEQRVFQLLNELSEQNPFCDVVFCGHSFGGALANLGAVRYASSYSSMTVSCHVFGCPTKVGLAAYRLLANSLPNLRVLRLEYGSDPYVKGIKGQGSGGSGSDQTWFHAGHSIVLTEEPLVLSAASTTSVQAAGGGGALTPSLSAATASAAAAGGPSPTMVPVSSLKVMAYRFDKDKSLFNSKSGNKQSNKHHHQSSSSSSSLSPWSGCGVNLNININVHNAAKLKKMKKDHELESYVQGLKQFSSEMRPWVTMFAGQDGKGVTGLDNEERCVV